MDDVGGRKEEGLRGRTEGLRVLLLRTGVTSRGERLSRRGVGTGAHLYQKKTHTKKGDDLLMTY